MCLIEDKKSAKLLASCVSVLLTGLVLYTKTKVIKKCRESILEYLLMNHPLDCPICDQGGECDLQDQTLVFGGDRSRFFDEKKKSTENKNFGLEIKMFLNRCIYCGRCVRFLNKLAGQNQNVLKLLGRGYNTEISFYEKFFSLPDQLTSNIIDLCPVGALVSKPSSFFYRPWEITFINSIDILDSYNSNIKIYFQGTYILKIAARTNNFLNGEWVSDKTRFFFDSLVLQRVVTPLFLSNSLAFISVLWLQFFNFFKVFLINLLLCYSIFFLKNFRILIRLGFFLDFESLIDIKCFFKKLGSNFFFKYKKVLDSANDFRLFYIFKKKSFTLIEEVSSCIILNTNLRIELPIINFKFVNLKKKLFNFFIFGFLSNFNFITFYLGNNIKFFYHFLEFFYLNFKIKSKKFLILCGDNLFSFIKNIFFFFKSYKKLFLIYFLYLFSSDVNIEELSFFKKNNFFLKNSNSLIDYNIDSHDYQTSSLNSLDKKKIIFFQGQHGDYSASYSDFILPTKNFIEKSSIYLNLEGWFQKIGSVNFKYTFDKVKTDSKIFLGLNEFFFKSQFNSSSKLLNYIYSTKEQLILILNSSFIKNKFSLIYSKQKYLFFNIFFKSQINHLNFFTYFRLSNNNFFSKFSDKNKMMSSNFNYFLKVISLK